MLMGLVALGAVNARADASNLERSFGPFVIGCNSDSQSEQVDCSISNAGETVFTRTLMPASPSAPIDIAVFGSTMAGSISVRWDAYGETKTVEADITYYAPRNGDNSYRGLLFSLPR